MDEIYEAYDAIDEVMGILDNAIESLQESLREHAGKISYEWETGREGRIDEVLKAKECLKKAMWYLEE